MSLAKALSILFIISKNQHLASVTFAIVFFVSTSVTSALIFLSFLLLILGFVCSSFSSCKKGPRVTGQDERKKVKEEERKWDGTSAPGEGAEGEERFPHSVKPLYCGGSAGTERKLLGIRWECNNWSVKGRTE